MRANGKVAILKAFANLQHNHQLLNRGQTTSANTTPSTEKGAVVSFPVAAPLPNVLDTLILRVETQRGGLYGIGSFPPQILANSDEENYFCALISSNLNHNHNFSLT